MHVPFIVGGSFSPEKKTLASGLDGYLRLWDTGTRQPLSAVCNGLCISLTISIFEFGNSIGFPIAGLSQAASHAFGLRFQLLR